MYAKPHKSQSVKYYTRHLGDYARDTQHLSPLEHGVFNLLLDRYYATEEPIPAKDIYRVAKATARPEKRAVDLILGEFFERRGDVFYSRRCHQEIERFRERSAKAKESSLLGVESRKRLASGYPTVTERSTDRSSIRNPVSGIRNKEEESEAKNGLSENPENIRKLHSLVSEVAQDHRTKESRR